MKAENEVIRRYDYWKIRVIFDRILYIGQNRINYQNDQIADNNISTKCHQIHLMNVFKKIFPKIYKYWSPDAGEGNCVKPKREAWVRKTEIRNLN